MIALLACAMGGAQPPFSTAGAAHPALHLRLLLLRAGDVEVNPGPVCSGCTGTIRVGSHPIICTQCQRLFHGYCNGRTRDQQSPGLRLRRLRQHEWLHHPTLTDYAVSTQCHLLLPNEHRSKQPSLLPLAPTYFDVLTAPFD